MPVRRGRRVRNSRNVLHCVALRFRSWGGRVADTRRRCKGRQSLRKVLHFVALCCTSGQRFRFSRIVGRRVFRSFQGVREETEEMVFSIGSHIRR